MRRARVLTIAGSDASGGAGIQCDIKTMHQHRVYAEAVPTLITVQNTRGVSQVHMLDAALVAAQVRALFEDRAPDVIKTGALGNAAIVRAVAGLVAQVAAPLVIDPVLSATSGATLLDDAGVEAMRAELFVRATLITPNAVEASRLLGRAVQTLSDATTAARELLASLGAQAVLVKGGHLTEGLADVLAHEGGVTVFEGTRVETSAGHGTGCALASAIAARLALGEPLIDAVGGARAWVANGLTNAERLSAGRGPLDLFGEVDVARRGSDPASGSKTE